MIVRAVSSQEPSQKITRAARTQLTKSLEWRLPPWIRAPRPRGLGALIHGGSRHSRLFVSCVRAALVIFWLGSWELTARTIIDPFFYSMPSQIWDKLVTWFTVGTSQGTIWANISITLQEAV